jgi:hypothetical protein
MAFFPIVNQDFASLAFSPTWGYGDVPVTMQFQLDNLPIPSTQTYAIGTLLGQSAATPGNLCIYDYTLQDTQPFKAVFFDETAPVEVAGVQFGFINCAINDRPSTLWLYSIINGANSGTADIDNLVTLGWASIVYQYENGNAIKLVQFKGMGTGA